MALSFAKKAQGGTAPAASSPAKPSTPSPKAATGGLSFLKKGTAAKKAFAHEEAKAEQVKAEQGKLWRFSCPVGDDRQITFLDGDLDDDGMLDIPMYYQHTLNVAGSYTNYVCTSEADETQPCPICETGDKPALVGVLTVIDHTPHTIQKGPNQGNIIKNTRKLFVAKRSSIKILTKLAQKRGGLRGCTFDVSRTGDKEPGVGNQFDFVEKHENPLAIAAKHNLKDEDVQPGNYAEEIVFRSPAELIDLGVGKAQSGPGYGKSSKSNYSDQL